MFKVILFLLVALGASLYFPASRSRVLDAAEPILNPVMTWSTKGEIHKITRDLETFERSWDAFPSEEAFGQWLSNQYHSDEGRRDSWGNAYVLKAWPDSFTVVSPGIDGQMGTPDDIRSTGQRPVKPRRRRH